VKGDKGTAGTTIMVEPAEEFKPRTSAKVRFEFAMNIYTEPAAPATETATDSTAPQARSWRDTLPIHPAAELFPRMSEAELAAAILFMADRLSFCRPDGTRQPANSGAPPVLVAFGSDDAERLKASGIPGAFVPNDWTWRPPKARS